MKLQELETKAAEVAFNVVLSDWDRSLVFSDVLALIQEYDPDVVVWEAFADYHSETIISIIVDIYNCVIEQFQDEVEE